MPIECQPLVTESGTVVGRIQVADQVYRRFLGDCEMCDCRRRMVRRFDGIHYGYTERCTACGSCYQDGWRLHLYPDDLAIARKWWNEAIPARDFDRRVRDIERRWVEAWAEDDGEADE
jgi:hypothetical protein